MSLFGTSPPNEGPTSSNSTMARSRNSLFDDDDPMTRSTSDTLFNDDDLRGSGTASPWDMPTPRKQQSRADLIRGLLEGADVPDSYIEAFDAAVREDGSGGKVASSGVTKTLAAARLGADDQAQIMGILAPAGHFDPMGRTEFSVLLALIGLAQEGETVSLDGVDERRRDLPLPQLLSSSSSVRKPVFPNTAELAAKPPQKPDPPSTPFASHSQATKPPMDGPEDDPWNSSDVHRNHNHGETPKTNGIGHANPNMNGNGYGNSDAPDLHSRAPSNFTASAMPSAGGAASQSAVSGSSNPGGWGYFDGNNAGGFGEPPNHSTSPFGGAGSGEGRNPGINPTVSHTRTISGGRTGSAVEENIVVTLMPEKEGKVIRRYSDFVWLLDCLHKRYPFRALPLLPPKRVAVNGNHLSNDGAFIEKRRRGLGRFLNTLVRHPVLGQEQLVIMFLTVPTVRAKLNINKSDPEANQLQELAVWRKQATISVVDEFTGRPLPPGLEESLPPPLEELFERTRQGVKRSADLYISTCNIMDRLVKRSEGVAADHGRMALSLTSLTETSADTYATDTNDVPLLNDGLIAMSKHLQTTQSLMEDESKAWDAGVLEDLKRQRDALVSVRDLFDRRERLDKDNIPHLERRIQNNETKLAGLRSKPEGMVRPGEIEKVVEAIIKDKESIVNQHNRSIFVKECIRDELVSFQQTQFHVSRWNQDWAQERVKYSEMLADNWRRLLDELEGMPLGD
ncbi:Sorting nexin mvp1 [Parahypoxylon ruwenzoriense]